MNRQVVLLTGASGSMGFEAFQLLWKKRDQYKIVLFLRPSAKNKKGFQKYEGEDLKIVWGDVQNREDVIKACRGIDWCLHTMALISPEADRRPEMAHVVNAQGTQYLVEAIEAEAPDRIKFVYIGSVAEYGDRLPPVHVGRTGDPILPSIFDYYAISKINGELTVMESKIRCRVSMRQTFIMIPGLFSLMDPIMFHQPIHSFMENITGRDAGRLLVKCLDMEEDSSFWGGYYNISGGPLCRTTFLEFLDTIYRMLGIDYRKVMDRNWFALKNFHMQFYEDSGKLNEYLHHWEGGYTMEDFFNAVWKKLPWYLKATAWSTKHIPPYKWLVQKITKGQLKKLCNKPDGTQYWIRHGEKAKINAFYGSLEKYKAIPGWEGELPSLDQNQPHQRLNHGYDETKEVLELDDLQKAAEFRGGLLTSDSWTGAMDEKLSWHCCQGHAFKLTPHSVLKGGHWCLDCIAPPWNYDAFLDKNRFASQVVNPVIAPSEQ